jgi:tetratricopeptide (TPR) repeat protein
MRISLSILVGGLLFLATTLPAAAQSPPKPRDTTIVGPQTFAMILGISKYKYVRPLTYADKDAEMFRDYLKSPGGGKVPDDNIFCLLNEQAVSSTFWGKGFKWLEAKKLRKGDRLFIYLAGHGDAIDEDQFFYIAYDCNPAGDKNNYLAGGVIQLYNLKLKIQRETTKGVEVFFIMDACRSNELPGGAEGQQTLNTAISEKNVGEIIMLATGAGQESLEDESIGNGHGLFTYYLVDGLAGMADSAGNVDNQITLAEIQKYIDKNVPLIAQQNFKRKQDPYFCCNENSEKVVGMVDTAYLRKWLLSRRMQSRAGNSYRPGSRSVFRTVIDDTVLVQTYNLFNKAIRDSRLTGSNSAEYYYNLMANQFPGTSYTIDAQSTLAVEFINFAQSKINLYLDCKDATTIQKIRAQVDDSEKTEDLESSLDRMEKVARQEFSEVGTMLEKAIAFIAEDDPAFAKSLQGRMYFFKARGFYGKDRRLMSIAKAFEYAYSAYATDRNAAYILNTLASLHFDNNRIDSAIHYARRAISSAPKWRYPYVTMAFAYKSLGKVDSALHYYRKAIQIEPGRADAYVDLGHYYYTLSRSDSAIANYQRALQLEPNNVYASNNIGWLHYERKNYADAITYFRRSILADPKFVTAYNGISKAFVSEQKFDSARVYFSKAFANYQDKSMVSIYIGNFYKDLKLYDSAKAYYRAAAELAPDYEEAWNYLGKVSFDMKQLDSATLYYRNALQVNPFSAFSLINLGLVHKENKQPDSTYFYFQRAIRSDPFNSAIINNMGVIYTQDRNYDSAKVYFKRALQVRPDYRPAYNNLMKVYRELGQVDSITNYLKSLPQFDPNSISTINDIGLIFLNQRRYDSARLYYRRAIALDPDNPQLYNNLGLAMRELRLYDSAKAYLLRSLQLNPENPSASTNIIGVFRQLGQFDSASWYFRKYMPRRWVNSDQMVESMANFFHDMKVYDSSIYYYRKVIGINPNHASAYQQIGAAYLIQEKNDSAFVYYRKAVDLDPKSSNANLNLGILYHNLRQYDTAIVYIQNAIRINPRNSKAYFDLACSYALTNKPEQAVLYLRQAFERGYRSYEALLTDPDLAGLKNYKEFQALLDKYIPDWKER